VGGEVVQLSDILKIIDICPGVASLIKNPPASDAGDGVTSVPIPTTEATSDLLGYLRVFYTLYDLYDFNPGALRPRIIFSS